MEIVYQIGQLLYKRDKSYNKKDGNIKNYEK